MKTALQNIRMRFQQSVTRALRLSSAAALAFTTAFGSLAVVPASAQSSATNYLRISAENAGHTRQVRLGLDKSIVVDLPADAHDILVANPEVADAVTRTSRRIYLFGKKIGQTNIFVFDGRGKQVAALELLIERDIAGLEETVRRLIPNSDVKAEMINDNIVLTGAVSTPQDAATAVRLAEIFVKGGEATDTGGSSAGASPGATTISLGGGEEDDKPVSQIVNMLKIDGEDQVHLKVVVAEIQRSVVKQLGLNTSVSNTNSDGFGFSVFGGGAPAQGVIPAAGGSTRLFNPLSAFEMEYRAMERNGVMRTLAEPSLTAISGEKAHFRVGGTYYIPTAVETDSDTGGAKVTMGQVEYGISLDFLPVVLSAGRISLKVKTEVSEPTTQRVSTGRSDANPLSVRKRLADTTVELPSGGSMVIAGLVQDDVRQTIAGQPGLRDIPFFGSLFRSREFVRDESEVVIIVTPYLVRPTARNKLVQPDKNFQPASDATGYFMGRVNRVYGTKQGDLPKGRYTGSIGFIFK